ncbi:hypothetical protein HD554DRAFT_2327288 [Boletus coccyginus]|nr:hypothetical protein HD554DRAFT_2327288 [Boletus coccyginus]
MGGMLGALQSPDCCRAYDTFERLEPTTANLQLCSYRPVAGPCRGGGCAQALGGDKENKGAHDGRTQTFKILSDGDMVEQSRHIHDRSEDNFPSTLSHRIRKREILQEKGKRRTTDLEETALKACKSKFTVSGDEADALVISRSPPWTRFTSCPIRKPPPPHTPTAPPLPIGLLLLYARDEDGGRGSGTLRMGARAHEDDGRRGRESGGMGDVARARGQMRVRTRAGVCKGEGPGARVRVRARVRERAWQRVVLSPSRRGGRERKRRRHDARNRARRVVAEQGGGRGEGEGGDKSGGSMHASFRRRERGGRRRRP